MTLLPSERYEGEREVAYARLRRLRDEWLETNGPCVLCGSTLNLEVDHIDRTTKDPAAKRQNIWYWNKERREAELAKCQVLCERCHMAKSNLEKKKDACPKGHEYTSDNILTFPGRPNIYECRICKNAYNRKLRERKRWAARIHREPRFVEFS